MENRPKVGVGVLVLKENKVLLGKRLKKDGSFSCWSLPGGHIEFGESPEEAAKRETKEETGLEIANICRGPYTYDIYEDGQKHFITLSFVADWVEGEAKALEPDRFSEWQWFLFSELPKPLFGPSQQALHGVFNLTSRPEKIKPGLYKHYKGNYYRVIDTVTHTETEETLVLYSPLYMTDADHHLCVRPLSMFIEQITANGKSQPRFEYVKETEKS